MALIPTPNFTDCLLAQRMVNDPTYNAIRIAHIVVGILINLLLAMVAQQLIKMKKLPLHVNLKLLLVNVLFCYFFFSWSFLLISIRYLIIYFVHTDPCDCLTPVWLSYMLRMPCYIYLIASPLFHFAIMVERVRATLFVHKYEQEGIKCGIYGVIIVWILTGMFGMYIVLTSVNDATFSQPLVYLSMTTDSNSQGFINVHYLFLFLVICISLADFLLIRINRIVRSQNHNTILYSLSQNYQAQENIGTMRIIFPLDFLYTLFFTIFIIVSAILRMERENMGLLKYTSSYEGILLILTLHAAITLCGYFYYLWKRNRFGQNNAVSHEQHVRPEEEAKRYFQQLQLQWAEK